MRIAGFRKLSLLDYPEKLCATVFTPGCNFRCPFCHNASLVREQKPGVRFQDELDEEEVLSFLEKRAGLLDGVCVTGGEPLLWPDLEEFISRVKALGFPVKLDTNGSFPERLEALLDRGLVDYVAMDIKNSLPNYRRTIGVDCFDASRIERSVNLLREGKAEYEFRTTLARELHDAESIAEIGRWLDGSPVYSLQAFCGDGDLLGDGLSAFSKEETEAFKELVRGNFGCVHIRGI